MSLTKGGPFPTKQLRTLSGHNGQIPTLTYSSPTTSSPSSQYLLTGSSDRTIRLFNPTRGTLIQRYTGAHSHSILGLSVAPDNTRFASVGGDKLVFLWDVATAKTLRRWEGHAGRVECVAFAGAQGDVLVSGSFDASVKVWDVRNQSGYKPVMSLTEARDSVSSVAVTPSGGEIIAGSVDGRVRTYDVRMGRCVVDVVGHAVTNVTCTRDGNAVLVSALDSTLRLFDRKDGTCLRAFSSPSFTNTEYRISASLGMNDSVVLSGSEDGNIVVWDLVEGQVLHRLRHSAAGAKRGFTESRKKEVVSAVAYCPSLSGSGRKEWCSAGGDGNVVVWGVEGGESRG